MKATGVVRKIDDLGRIVMPKEIRTVNGWTEGMLIEFFVTEGTVHIKAYEKQCAACSGTMKELVKVKNIHVCKDCLAEVK